MLGGINTAHFKGEKTELAYYIEVDRSICCIDIEFEYHTEFYKITLEEFLKEFPYKVGDKVTVNKNVEIINRMRWNGNEIVYGFFTTHNLGELNVNIIQPYKEETINRKYNVEEYLKVWEETEKGLEVIVNNNFELKEDSGKFYIIKKKPQYPKTYEECCKILKIDYPYFKTEEDGISASTYKNKLFGSLKQLLICRDAYWKIAGEQMGLGKPWEPDWSNTNSNKYCIYFVGNEIKKQPMLEVHHFLAFPTAEMRNAFFENFKKLIESCKEFFVI